MEDFPITPAIVVRETPKPRRLKTIKEARDYIDEAMRLGRPEPWREVCIGSGRLPARRTQSRRLATYVSCSTRRTCCFRTTESISAVTYPAAG